VRRRCTRRSSRVRAVLPPPRRTDSAPKTKEYECAKALAEEVDAADFLHIETGHLSQIGASSLTDEEMEVADADMEVTRFRRRTFPSGTRICCLWRPRTRRRLSRRRCLSGRTPGTSQVSRLSPGFFDAFQNVIDVGTKPETAIELKAPFVEWSKTGSRSVGWSLTCRTT